MGLYCQQNLNSLYLRISSSLYYDLLDIDDKKTGVVFQLRALVDACNLNMGPAIDRCENTYSKALKFSQVEYGTGDYNKNPFVTIACPDG